jgi:glycine/sarcosine/betaine reductase complex component A
MDLENQARVKEIAQRYNKRDVVVVLGAADAESVRLLAETVTLGDPSYAGALGGVQLGLPVYHILEPELKAQVDPEVYQEQVGMMELVVDVPRLIEPLRKIREAGGS